MICILFVAHVLAWSGVPVAYTVGILSSNTRTRAYDYDPVI